MYRVCTYSDYQRNSETTKSIRFDPAGPEISSERLRFVIAAWDSSTKNNESRE